MLVALNICVQRSMHCTVVSYRLMVHNTECNHESLHLLTFVVLLLLSFRMVATSVIWYLEHFGKFGLGYFPSPAVPSVPLSPASPQCTPCFIKKEPPISVRTKNTSRCKLLKVGSLQGLTDAIDWLF